MPSTPRGQRTRQMIMERASAVFEARGFAATSLSHLVEATGLTRGAFYFHFESKEALALAIVQAQAERWPPLLMRVREQESEPLRRLLRLAFAAAEAVQRDPLVRGAHRLMTERALIRGELPNTFQWWVTTVHDFLAEADARGELPDLTPLIKRGASLDDPVTALAEYVVGRWAGLQQAALASRRDDLLDRAYTGWVLLLPWLCKDAAQRADLLAFLRELTADL